MEEKKYMRVGVEVGGTFTDLVAIEGIAVAAGKKTRIWYVRRFEVAMFHRIRLVALVSVLDVP